MHDTDPRKLAATRRMGVGPDPQRRRLLQRALGALAVGAGALLVRPVRANDLRLGELAPPLTLHTLDGQSVTTRELLGQVVIPTFWATWCAPCQEELPVLSAYAERHARDGLRVLGFSLDDAADLAKVRAVASTLKFPVGLLGSPYAGGYGRIWRCPVSFVIDRSGRLVDNGWDDSQPAWTPERLKQIVDPVLARTT